MHPINFFLRRAMWDPERIAAIHGPQRITYRELAARVSALANALRGIERREQSRVAICADNSIDHLTALLATMAAGKIWIPLNPRESALTLSGIVAFTRPSILIVAAHRLDKLDPLAAHVVRCDTPAADRDGTTLASLVARNMGERPPSIEAGMDACQAIKFTGGTTGSPKGVQQPYRAWLATTLNQIHAYGLSSSDRFLAVAPLTHGTSTYVVPFLAQGGALVFPESLQPGDILQQIRDHAVTTAFLPPTIVQRLTAAAAAHPASYPSMRHLIYGAAPMRPEAMRAAQDAFGPVLCATYGQTEAPQILTRIGPDELMLEANLTSVGRPGLLSEIAITAPDGAQLPPGQIGEVVAHGDLLMSGYLDMPEKTAEVLRNGWLHTGDTGLIDERGYLFLKDRLKDLVITGGFNVYPTDVEAVLGAHPAIFDCAVFGVPDENWGEAVHAAVQLKPGVSVPVQSLIERAPENWTGG